MKASLKIIFVILTIVSCNASCSRKYNTITYHLSGGMINKVYLVEYEKNDYAVSIILKDQYSKEFGRITDSNVGKILNVVFDGKVIISAVIKEGIHSGMMRVGNIKDKKDAEDLTERIRESVNGTQ